MAWPEQMTLPMYISTRREFDNMPTHKVMEALRARGKIDTSATFDEVHSARLEAKRLVDRYLL